MSEPIVPRGPEASRELRCLQALDGDPLFDGARYTFSVEGEGAGFEIVITVSPYFVHLLTLAERRGLEEIAVEAAGRLLDHGVHGATSARISADGRLMQGGTEIAGLLPLQKVAAPAAAAH